MTKGLYMFKLIPMSREVRYMDRDEAVDLLLSLCDSIVLKGKAEVNGIDGEWKVVADKL